MYKFSSCNWDDDSYLRIYDYNGNLVKENDNNGSECNPSNSASLTRMSTISGMYYVLVTNSYCSVSNDTIDLMYRIDLLTEIDLRNKSAIEKSFKLFPNPSNDVIDLYIEFAEPLESNIQIINSLGNEVYSKELLKANKIDEQLKVKDLPKGLYIVKIIAGENQIAKTFIVY